MTGKSLIYEDSDTIEDIKAISIGKNLSPLFPQFNYAFIL
jgi:hypothetical protein